MAGTCAMQQVLFMGSNRQPSYVTGCGPLLSANDLVKGEVLVRVLCAAICPTDLEIIGNKQLEQELPSGLGHEGVGEIVATKRLPGDDEEPLVPGDRIIFCSLFCSDHVIPDPQIFQTLPSAHGVGKLHFGGTFSSHCILKSDAHLLKLPNSVPSSLGAIINCPLATMTSVLTTTIECQRAHFQDSSRNIAIIQGTTVRGLFSCAFLRENGFSNVFVVEKSHYQWKLIKDFGGTPTYCISDSQIKSILQNNRLSLIIDTDHCQHFCATALDKLSSDGVYILAGTPHCDLIQLPTRTIITKNLTIKGANSYRAKHLTAAVEFLAATIHRYPYESLVTSPFPFSSFSDAISCAAKEQVQRVIIQTTNSSESGL